jgi:hypothetical protein
MNAALAQRSRLVIALAGISLGAACATGSDADPESSGSPATTASDTASGGAGGGSATSTGGSTSGSSASTGGGGGGASSSSTGTASGGAGGTGGAGGGGGSTTGTGGSATTSSTAACALGHVVISELRTRGPGGGNDDFIELFNASPSPVTFDSAWKVEARASTVNGYLARWTGGGETLPPFSHFLIANSAGSYSDPKGDVTMGSGIGDAGSVRLRQGALTVDAICYQTSSESINGHTCEGSPAKNPDGAKDLDSSLQRKHCVDTGNSYADFEAIQPSSPMNLASGPTP